MSCPIKTYKMTRVGCITLQYMMWLRSQTSHMHCFLQHIGANKQTMTLHVLMICACSSCQMNANIFCNSGNWSKQFHWIPNVILLIFIHHQACQNFSSLTKKFKNKYKDQSAIKHLTFASIVLNLEWRDNDSPPFPMPPLPTIDEQVPIICGNNAK